MLKWLLLIAFLAWLLSVDAAAAPPQKFVPRAELSTPMPLVLPAEQHELVVKFRDNVKLRVENNAIVSRAGSDIKQLDVLLQRHGSNLSPLIKLPIDTLAAVEQRAIQRSKKAQPDLAGLMRATAPADQLLPLAEKLAALEVVEWVQFVSLAPPPPCDDIAPTTPPFAQFQTYHNRNPGIAMSCAWRMNGAKGDGIRLADCEYGLNINHEDLCGVILEPGQTINPSVFNLGYDEHGTAVAGMLVGLENDYGCTGLVPNVDYYHFSEWTVEEGLRRASCIAAAIAVLDAGDILLLEMQTRGPSNELLPAEFELAVWMLTRVAADAGIVVVAAAGNGGRNIGAIAYQEYINRGDSGAIMVGAGTPNTTHARTSTSNHGNRVNVQGWGAGIVSTGYGDFVAIAGDKNQNYTDRFSGTSGGAAMVAAACVAIQSLSLVHFGTTLDPEALRDLLIDTGIPQGGSTSSHIGPFPHIPRAAIAIGIDFNDCVGNGYPNICRIADGTEQDTNFDQIPDACQSDGDLDGDGAVNVFDLFILLGQWGPCEPNCELQCAADFIVPSCAVDADDLMALLANWTN